MPKSTLRSRAWLIGAAAMLAAGAASAHITIFPKTSTLGEREKYMMRVPNERKVATVRIDAEFPPELKVTSFEDKPGWKVEAKRDASGTIVGATWTGVLPADGFNEFGILATNPKAGASVTWKFIQYYEGGEIVQWTGPKGSKTPAPVVALVAAAPATP